MVEASENFASGGKIGSTNLPDTIKFIGEVEGRHYYAEANISMVSCES